MVLALGVWACSNYAGRDVNPNQNFSKQFDNPVSLSLVKVGQMVNNQAVLTINFADLDTAFRRFHRENYGIEAQLTNALISTHKPDSSDSYPYLILIGKNLLDQSSLNMAHQADLIGTDDYFIYENAAIHICKGQPCESCGFTRKDNKWWKRITGCKCLSGGGYCEHTTISEPIEKKLIDILKAII